MKHCPQSMFMRFCVWRAAAVSCDWSASVPLAVNGLRNLNSPSEDACTQLATGQFICVKAINSHIAIAWTPRHAREELFLAPITEARWTNGRHHQIFRARIDVVIKEHPVLDVAGRPEFSRRDVYRSSFDPFPETIDLEDVVNAGINLSLRWNGESQGRKHGY